MLNKLLFLSLIFLGCLSGIHADEKMYIDSKDLSTKHDVFRIHVGHNVWIETDTIHRDATGLYTFESSIARSMCKKDLTSEYQKSWKCPYCHHYWPIGTACQNKDCPSKYK